MPETITVESLFSEHKKRLALEWATCRHEGARPVSNADLYLLDQDSGELSSIGHYESVPPRCVLVITVFDFMHHGHLLKQPRTYGIHEFFQNRPTCIVLADNLSIPDNIRQEAESTGTPVLTSTLSGHELIDYIQYSLSPIFRDRVTVHGVFMEVIGLGVLISGESGIGKSELALELITRGHRIIADDSPELLHTHGNNIMGVCPPALQDFMEVRGLGVLNIRTLYGNRAIRYSSYLSLIVDLKSIPEQELHQIDRLHGIRETESILSVNIPRITLPVAPGRNLAVIIEAALRNYMLSTCGYDSAQDFIDKQAVIVRQGKS